MGNATTKITDGTHHSPQNTEKGDYLYITAKNIKDDGVLLDDISYVTEEDHEEIYSRCNPEYGDILYIKDGATTGVTTINDLKEPFSMLSSVALLKTSEIMHNPYFVYFFRSGYYYSQMRGEMTGAAITRVTLTKLNNALMAIPPLEEQHRVVQRIEELFAICDRFKAQLEIRQAVNERLVKGLVGKVLEGS